MGEKIQNPKSKIQNLKSPCLLHFEIEDTGPGIKINEVKALFQSFVQTEAGRQSQQGTGLGLAISRQFVRLMGGDISVKSVLGRGTTFKFDILVDFVQKMTKADVTSASRKVIGLEPNQPSYRILVVEDNRMNRLALVRLLKSCGFQVQEASNGEEAIAQWRRWRPDLIWMDIRMPIMDGREATRRIKAEGGKSEGADVEMQYIASEEDRGNGEDGKDGGGVETRPVTSGDQEVQEDRGPGLGNRGLEIDKGRGQIQNPKSKIQNPKSIDEQSVASRRVSQNPTSPIIIALTASAFEEDRAAILAAGCDDIVNKPFRHGMIFDMMAHYLGAQYLYQD